MSVEQLAYTLFRRISAAEVAAGDSEEVLTQFAPHRKLVERAAKAVSDAEAEPDDPWRAGRGEMARFALEQLARMWGVVEEEVALRQSVGGEIRAGCRRHDHQ